MPRPAGAVTNSSVQWAPISNSRAILSAVKTAQDGNDPVEEAQPAPQPAPQRPTLAPPPAPIPVVAEPAPEAPARVEISPAAEPVAHAGLARLQMMLRDAGVKPGASDFQFDLSDRELHPVVLDTLFTAFFGEDWHDWEPETLDNALKEVVALGGGTISDVNRAKLQAISVVHVTTYPWVSMMPFGKTAIALDGRLPDFEILEPVHPGTMLCAISVMRRINAAQRFSHEVLRYIATSCLHDGLMIFPDPVEGPLVNQVIARLCDRSVSREEYAALESLWRRFSEAGLKEYENRDLDDVDESNLGDYQLAMASRAAAYAAEYEARMANQFSALARWAAQAGAKQ
jgi:hypothetical protein